MTSLFQNKFWFSEIVLLLQNFHLFSNEEFHRFSHGMHYFTMIGHRPIDIILPYKLISYAVFVLYCGLKPHFGTYEATYSGSVIWCIINNGTCIIYEM